MKEILYILVTLNELNVWVKNQWWFNIRRIWDIYETNLYCSKSVCKRTASFIKYYR